MFSDYVRAEKLDKIADAIKEVRKDIARINTVLTERKIAESKNA